MENADVGRVKDIEKFFMPLPRSPSYSAIGIAASPMSH